MQTFKKLAKLTSPLFTGQAKQWKSPYTTQLNQQSPLKLAPMNYQGIRSMSTMKGSGGLSGKDKPETARREMSQEELESILEEGKARQYRTFRTHNEDVAQNQELRFTGQSLATAREGIHFGQGLEGFDYGPHHVLVHESETDAMPTSGKSEEYFTSTPVSATTGRYFHNDTLKAARKAVDERRKAAKTKSY